MAHLTVSQYITMLEAGYTAEELDRYNREQSTSENPNIISNPAQDRAAAAPENPNIISNPAQDRAAAAPENPNISNPAQAATATPNEEARQLVAEMHELVSLMRNANLRNINMPTDPPPDPARIAASILAPRNNTKE